MVVPVDVAKGEVEAQGRDDKHGRRQRYPKKIATGIHTKVKGKAKKANQRCY